MPDLGRTMVIKRRTTFKIGLVVGAAVMYLLDPQRGPERRKRLRERIVTAPRTISRFIDEMWGAVDQAQTRLEDAADRYGDHADDAQADDGQAGDGQQGNGAWSSAESETADLP
jgi:gas vesicle protein